MADLPVLWVVCDLNVGFELLCATVVQLFSKFTFFVVAGGQTALHKENVHCPIYLWEWVWSHAKFPIRSCCANTMGLAGLQDTHLALERGATEGDGHDSGTMPTAQTHYTAEREGGVKLKTDLMILRIHRLDDLKDTQAVISAKQGGNQRCSAVILKSHTHNGLFHILSKSGMHSTPWMFINICVLVDILWVHSNLLHV